MTTGYLIDGLEYDYNPFIDDTSLIQFTSINNSYHIDNETVMYMYLFGILTTAVSILVWGHNKNKK